MSLIILSLLVIVAAALFIRADYVGPTWQVYLFKPLATILVISIALLTHLPTTSSYQYLILAGLLCSLVGDIFLMLPNKFLPGLGSFLFAHLAYILAFSFNGADRFSPLLLSPFLLYGAIILWLLYPYLKEMKIPVIIYMLFILTMSYQGLMRGLATNTLSSYLAFIGAVLFMISDSIIALDRFGRPFKAAKLLLNSTYYLAQLLIALSV